jgi:hypothetical protein
MTELANKARMFDRIRELFGVGPSCEHHVTLTCATHCKDFADKLHAIEREYFMTEGAIEEEFPDSHPEQVCMVNSWGDSTDEYVKHFGEALNKIYKYDQLIAENAAQQKLITQQAEQLKMLHSKLALANEWLSVEHGYLNSPVHIQVTEALDSIKNDAKFYFKSACDKGTAKYGLKKCYETALKALTLSDNAKIPANPVSAINPNTKIEPIRATSKNKDDVYRLLNAIHSMAGTCAVAKAGNWQLASSCSEESYTMTTWTNGIVDVKAVTINGEDHSYSLTATPKASDL